MGFVARLDFMGFFAFMDFMIFMDFVGFMGPVCASVAPIAAPLLAALLLACATTLLAASSWALGASPSHLSGESIPTSRRPRFRGC